MTENMIDVALLNVLKQVGGNPDDFLKIVLSFLNRKTNYFKPANLALPAQTSTTINSTKEHSVSKSRKPNESLNNSFDDFPTQDTQELFERNRKQANVPVKKKEERSKLSGFSCRECRDYYQNTNMPQDKVCELIQNCSRHRATIPPPINSPIEWLRTEFVSPDKSTQYDTSPLPTRARLRAKKKLFEEREQADKQFKVDKEVEGGFKICPVCELKFPSELLPAHGPVCANQRFDLPTD